MSKGVILSILASVLFAGMYFYTSLLTPLSGEEIFGWRTLLTAPFITVFLMFRGDWRLVRNIVRRLRQQPGLLLSLLASSALVSVQMWLFMWAPLNGRGLDVSLGYFLLPLTMIATGRIIYRESFSLLRKLAALCAIMGVLNELYQVGSFSWATLLVCLGYPFYFILRRRCGTDNLGGLWFDMTLILPVALWFALSGELSLAVLAQRSSLYLLIPLLGVISALALICYILASRFLSFSLFGLLGYVEPVLLVGVALLLGESIRPSEWLTYIPIWLAVALLILEGVQHLLANGRSQRTILRRAA